MDRDPERHILSGGGRLNPCAPLAVASPFLAFLVAYYYKAGNRPRSALSAAILVAFACPVRPPFAWYFYTSVLVATLAAVAGAWWGKQVHIVMDIGADGKTVVEPEGMQ